MREGIKIGIVTLMIILLTACSASRKRRSYGTMNMSTDAEYSEMVESVKRSNITEDGFIINKGHIELYGTAIEGKFGINAKVNKKGDLSASVRGPLGIELVRILAVGNDIAAIDRFNKTVYIGKRDEIMKRYAMPENFINILFGDMPESSLRRLESTNNGILRIESTVDEVIREMSICIGELKICSEQIWRADNSAKQIMLQFSDFRMAGNRKYASSIQMEEDSGMFHVKLFIDELETGYNSDIEFKLPSYMRMNL
ncbi:MAG: DUF4292 domain-containing protein [Bacteroidales bacterium]|jgi:hypothetical protein|nr:DUF4292 domain-containing protein [Bacteroidales bacterium]